jgi:DHA2 family multidrug resistance protein
MIAFVSLSLCAVIEIRRREPFVNLRLLCDRNFGFATLVSMAFGAGMYGATYLLPMYLAQVQGYNAQQIGETIMWSGVPQLFMMPIAAGLLRVVDARVLLTAGLCLFGGSSWLNSAMTSLSGYEQLKITQVVRAMGMPLVIVPLTTLATSHIRPEQAGSASALFNMFRNLGGSIGIALLATQLDLREKLHSVRLGEAVNSFNPMVSEHLNVMVNQFFARGTEKIAAAQQALGVMASGLRRESCVMAYADCFNILAVLLLVTVPIIWLCKSAKGGLVSAH